MNRLVSLGVSSILTLSESMLFPVLVNIRNRIKAPVAAGILYLVLLLTTPPSSAFWVPEDAMVVSEMGPRLSQKAAPDTIAPIRYSGEIPARTPTGNNMGITTK